VNDYKLIKTTKKTTEEISGALDTYHAEVSSGEYKANLWDIDNLTNTVLINGVEGAAMFLNCLDSDFYLCETAMYQACGDSKEYGIPYRMKARLTKVHDQVVECFEDEIFMSGIGKWQVK